MSEQKHLDELQKVCKEYSHYDSYFYKLCRDVSDKNDKTCKWLIIMTKTVNSQITKVKPECITCAIIRATNLKVIKIINIFDSSITTNKIVNKIKYSRSKRIYAVNEIVKGYENAIECCFSITRTYYCRDMPKNYTGKWINYYKDSYIKKSEINYRKGIKNGKMIEWNSTGQTPITYAILCIWDFFQFFSRALLS